MSEQMSKERALQILKSRKIVNATGKYQVKVTSVHPYEDKFIVNLGAMNMYQAVEARKNLAEENFQEAVNSNLSLSIFADRPCPSKGEIINVFVDNVALKVDGKPTGETALLATSWSEVAVSAGVVNFSFEDSVAEVLTEAEHEFSASAIK